MNLLSEEELEQMPKANVRYVYTEGKKEFKAQAIMKLDRLLTITIKLNADEVMLLQQWHKNYVFGSKEELKKEYVLTKGTYGKGTTKERPWYCVNLLVTPGRHTKYFLNPLQILYVQRAPELERMFLKVN